MYQPLIWPEFARDQTCGMRAAFDTEYLEGQADALVHGMRRNAKLERDFFR